MLTAEWKLEDAVKVSRMEGEKRGEEKGMEIAAEKIARAMKEKGADINFIAEVTNLPIDTIQRL
jgi:predicted transposase YdaD